VSEDFNVIIGQDQDSVIISDANISTTSSSSTAIVGQTTYTHDQASPSSSWTITHNLGRRPSVTIVDSAGNVQIGEVLYNSDNQITVTFAASFGGYAYLN
jgi:hypothetical protein